MWPSSHSSCSRTSRICRPSRSDSQRSCSSSTVSRVDALDRHLLLAPRGHAAGQVAADVAQPDRAGERGGLDRVLVVAPHQDDRLLGVREPGELRPEARRGARCSTPRRGCATRRTGARCARRPRARRPRCACCTCRGVSGWASTVSLTSGPRLSATMFLKFGGCGPSAAVVCSTNSSSSPIWSSVLVVALEADRRRHLQVHPGPPHSDPPRWPGQTSVVSGSDMSFVVQRAEDAARALLLVDRQVGPRDVADEQRVAGQHRPRLVAAVAVDQRERGVLGAVARGVQRTDGQRAELELPAVVERLVVVLGLGVAVDVDRRARRRRPAGRGPTRGRRGCASRGCARSARPGSEPDAGTRRCRAWGRRPPRRRRPRRRPGSSRSPGHRG